MNLRPQDILVALKLALAREALTYAALGHELGLSASDAHGAVKRLASAGLLIPNTRDVNRQALLEFLVHGLKYVLPAQRGPIARGIPTAHAAPPLNALIRSGGQPPPVWPSADGDTRGETFEPLCKSATFAAGRDVALYRALALVDAIRGGRARERALAETHLSKVLA